MAVRTNGQVFRIHLVTGGRFHDTNFARLELLKLLHEDERVRVSCCDTYMDVASLDASHALITYTCDVMPTESETEAIARFVERGGRIFALHGSNSVIRFTDGPALSVGGIHIPGLVADSAAIGGDFKALLGSSFVAHLALGRFHVCVTDPDHPVVAGIHDFEIFDEPYFQRMIGPSRILMTARYVGEAHGYVVNDWHDDQPRPQMYVKDYGKGGILYLTLGHCSGKFDQQPIMDEGPVVRGAWDSPIFYDILRRGIAWAKGEI